MNLKKINWGWTKDPDDQRDREFRYKSIRPKLTILANVVYLINPPVKDQGNLGSCVFNGVLSEMESVMIQRDDIPPTELSRLFAYWNYRKQYDVVNQDNGAYPRDALKVIAKDGICLENEWPYEVEKFADRPPENCFTSAQKFKIQSYHRLEDLEDMLTCIAEGWPFGCGIYVYKSFMSNEVKRTGVVPMPSPGEEILGGHYVYFGGYDRHKRIFIGQNSWGTSWGKNGAFTIPFDYLTNPSMCDDQWTVRTLALKRGV